MFGRDGDNADRFGSSVVVDRDAYDTVQSTGSDVHIGLPWWFIVGVAAIVLIIGLGLATGKVKVPGKEDEQGGGNAPGSDKK
jgi:hypothetical protein